MGHCEDLSLPPPDGFRPRWQETAIRNFARRAEARPVSPMTTHPAKVTLRRLTRRPARATVAIPELVDDSNPRFRKAAWKMDVGRPCALWLPSTAKAETHAAESAKPSRRDPKERRPSTEFYKSTDLCFRRKQAIYQPAPRRGARPHVAGRGRLALEFAASFVDHSLTNQPAALSSGRCRRTLHRTRRPGGR